MEGQEDELKEYAADLPQNVNSGDIQESLLEEPGEMIEEYKPEEPTTPQQRNWFVVILFYMTILVCVIVATALGVYLFFFWPFKGRNVKSVTYNGFEVIFDVDTSTPVSSRIFKWIKNPPSQRPPWSDHEVSRIKASDFFTQVPFPGTADFYDRGHLSPYGDLGGESMNVINVVPQVKCHNAGVWNEFEMFVRRNYFGETILTYPKYNFTTWFETKNGKLYVPHKMCKKIKGVDYCMDHHSGLCGKPWCGLVTPSIC